MVLAGHLPLLAFVTSPGSQTTAGSTRQRPLLPEEAPSIAHPVYPQGKKPWLQEDRKQGLEMVAQAPPHPRSFLEADTMPGREGGSSVPAFLGRNSGLPVSTRNRAQDPEL